MSSPKKHAAFLRDLNRKIKKWGLKPNQQYERIAKDIETRNHARHKPKGQR